MHSPPRRPRSVPPLADDPTLSGVVKRLETWKVLLAMAVAVAAFGAAFASWNSGKATVEQLDEVKASLAAQVGAVQGGTEAKLGEIKGQVQELRERQVGVEAQLDILIGLSERLLDQSAAIAKATGARQIPAAPPPEPSHPPPLGGLP